MPPGLAADLIFGMGIGPLILGRAATVLAPILSSSAELLPVITPIGDYSIFNVIDLVPALIEERSDVFRYPSSGRIGYVTSYELDPAVVADHPIFKLASWPLGAMLVDETFVDAVLDARLTGFAFKKVWPTNVEAPPTSTRTEPKVPGDVIRLEDSAPSKFDVLAIPEDTRAELDGVIAEAFGFLELEEDAPPDETQAAIRNVISDTGTRTLWVGAPGMNRTSRSR